VKVSAVIITLNEERNIADAIDSLDFVDEVVVVDSGSTDRTREIAAARGARVLFNEWPGFSAQKQFATDAAANNLILSLDADERISAELKTEIIDISKGNSASDGYRIPRLSYYLGRPIRHSGWYPDHQLRLFDRRKGRWNGRVIHESVAMEAGTTIASLRGNILHHTVTSRGEHARMIKERYAPLAAQQMFAEGRNTSRIRGLFSGAASFLRSYVIRQGFLDGYAGISIAYFAALHNVRKHSLLMEMRKQGDSAVVHHSTTNR